MRHPAPVMGQRFYYDFNRLYRQLLFDSFSIGHASFVSSFLMIIASLTERYSVNDQQKLINLYLPTAK
jgi:hypothetical protein